MASAFKKVCEHQEEKAVQSAYATSQMMVRLNISFIVFLLPLNSDRIMSIIKAFVERNKSWLRKVGLAGFLFFLLKGIVWLVVGYLVLK